MSFEAYSVAVSLRLVDQVSSGLIGIAGHFKVLEGTVGKTQAQILALEASWKKIKTTALIGGAAMAAGIGGLELLAGPIKAVREYELAFTKFKTLNLGDAINAQADKFARGSNLMNVSATELMGTLSESVGLFGSYAEAQKHAGQLAQLGIANSAVFGGKISGMDEGAIRGLMKFLDRRGALSGDEATYQKGLSIAERLVTGSGGFIQFKDLAAFSQMGGTAFRALSDEGLMNMSLLMQEQGGSKAATALMSGYQNLVAGRTPVKTLYALQDMGLATLGQVTHGTVGGKTSTSVVMKSLKDSDLYQSNPTEWYRKTFLGALAEHGITDTPTILKMTNDLLSNRTASNQASIMDTQTLQVIRDALLTKNAMDQNQVIEQYNKDPNQRWTDLTAKYKNMLVELGEAALPLVTKALSGMLAVIRGITVFAQHFPTTTKLLVGAFAVLAGLTAAGGAIALIAAGFRGLALIPGITSLGGALSSVAGGLGALAGKLGGVGGLLGKAGLIGAAGLAGYELGSWLNDKFKLDEKIGAALSPTYDPNKQAPSRFVTQPKPDSQVRVHTQINMDGRKVSEIVSGHIADGMGNNSGGMMYDPTLSAAPVGLNFLR